MNAINPTKSDLPNNVSVGPAYEAQILSISRILYIISYNLLRGLSSPKHESNKEFEGN
jgi:hypothetical protein